MNITKFSKNVENVSALPDRPALADGYDPETLKGIFDRSARDIKEYINDTLTEELSSSKAGESGADRIGSARIYDLEGTSVRDQLISLKNHIDTGLGEIALGTLPNHSISASMLSDELIDSIGGANTLKCFIFDEAGEYDFEVPQTGIYRLRMTGGGGEGTMLTDKSLVGTYDCFGGASGGYLECFLSLKRGAGATVTVGAGGVGHSAGHSVGDNIAKEDYVGHPELFSASEGGDSSFGSDEIGFMIVCPGADNSAKHDYTLTATEGGELSGRVEKDMIIYRRGKSQGFEISGDKIDPSSGADSFLGSGGSVNDAIPPSHGAGGGGGRINLTGISMPNKYAALPQKGADGIVILEYVGA